MSRREKLIARLKSKPNDFTWREVNSLLGGLGYKLAKPGKTGGSIRQFIHPEASKIVLHKPHPGDIVKGYVVAKLLRSLSRDHLI